MGSVFEYLAAIQASAPVIITVVFRIAEVMRRDVYTAVYEIEINILQNNRIILVLKITSSISGHPAKKINIQK